MSSSSDYAATYVATDTGHATQDTVRSGDRIKRHGDIKLFFCGNHERDHYERLATPTAKSTARHHNNDADKAENEDEDEDKDETKQRSRCRCEYCYCSERTNNQPTKLLPAVEPMSMSCIPFQTDRLTYECLKYHSTMVVHC
ncbi:hypothetical protein ACLKA7_011992 [Drosophila subpalustris]